MWSYLKPNCVLLEILQCAAAVGTREDSITTHLGHSPPVWVPYVPLALRSHYMQFTWRHSSSTQLLLVHVSWEWANHVYFSFVFFSTQTLLHWSFWWTLHGLVISVATVVDCLLKFSIENGMSSSILLWRDYTSWRDAANYTYVPTVLRLPVRSMENNEVFRT